jgi:predicted alpha-1,2-mannosidase
MLHRPLLAVLILVVYSATGQDLTRYVDPMTGTGGVGHTYPGATVPYGMVQLSPDTRRDQSWEGCSGYYYADTLIYGFSHTHLSGTGASDYGDILVMPFTGERRFEPASYASRYRHTDEYAMPGYYAVTLTDDDIRAEMTSTTRAGLHRYTFPTNTTGDQQLLLDLRHRDKTLDATMHVVSPTRIEGSRRSEGWARNQRIFFVMEFSRPLTECIVIDGNSVSIGTILDRPDLAVTLRFAPGSDTLLVRVGISSVDREGARKNLEAEMPHWDFTHVKSQAARAWNAELGRVHVYGIDTTQLITFYTALYHAMVAPNVLSDVDGRYRGRDDSVHVADGHTQYTVFSLWDTFRAAHPLYTLIDSVRALDYVKTFLNQYKQGGRLPVWELSANETDCMIGYHSVPVIADALVKGINDFDTTLALEAMKASATWDHLGVPAYMGRGYIGVDDEHESVSKTLEYAYDDWCIAEVARILGKADDARTYYRRAASYRNMYDPGTGFMRPRRNGDWLARFDPREVNNHFTEANSWQYTFFVPQDIPGMISMMGGAEATDRKLDSLFTAPTKTTGREQADITGLIGQYAHGNEPSHHMAYLYNYIGKPWKTQRLVRTIMDSLYKLGPDGMPGNEDCGQMSAWYVWSALGLYPVTPGSPYYAIGSPLFDSARVSIGKRTLRITAERASPGSIYLQSLIIDGKAHEQNLVTHEQLTSARELRFVLGDAPNMTRGTTIEQRGVLPEAGFVAAPFIKAAGNLFYDSTLITIHGENVRYSVDGDSLHLPMRYTGPFMIAASTRIHARSYNGADSSGVTTAFFHRLPAKWQVVLHSTLHPQYVAEGPISMIDGLRGTPVWRKGEWHGIYDKDMDVEIVFDTLKDVAGIDVGFLQDVRPWIVYPTDIAVQTSLDGTAWTTVGTAKHDVPVTDMTPQIMELSVSFPSTRARHVRVRATAFGKLPAWHPGAGYPSFIFCDEIRIK